MFFSLVRTYIVLVQSIMCLKIDVKKLSCELHNICHNSIFMILIIFCRRQLKWKAGKEKFWTVWKLYHSLAVSLESSLCTERILKQSLPTKKDTFYVRQVCILYCADSSKCSILNTNRYIHVFFPCWLRLCRYYTNSI